MKIAFIGLRGVPAQYSGIEKAVEEIGSRLVQDGHEVTVYCMAGRYKEKPEVFKGMKLRYIPTIKSKNLEMIVYAVLSTMDTLFKKYDIVHFHALGPSTMAFFPRIFGKKTVSTVHGLDWQRAKWSLPARLYLKFGEWCSCFFAGATIVVSRTLKKYYEDKYSKIVHYVPNGMDLPDVVPLDESEKKFDIQKNGYFLFVGRLTKEKNVHVLIEAFKSVKTDKKLLIVGGSTHTDDYIGKLKMDSSGDSRIIFTGPIYGKELAELYSNAFLFILPSEVEGLPVVLMEALGFGNAVLVSNIPENIEVIKDNDSLCGLTFKVGEKEDLIRVLNEVVENPDMVMYLKGKGKSLEQSKYSWGKIAKETLGVYKKLLNR